MKKEQKDLIKWADEIIMIEKFFSKVDKNYYFFQQSM